MFQLMDMKIITILLSKILLNWPYSLFQVKAYLKKYPFQLPQDGVGIMDGVDEGNNRLRS